VKTTLRGIPEALGRALAFGTMFWLFYFFVQPASGYIWPLILLKTMASGSSLVALHYARKRMKAPAEAVSTPSRPAVIWLLAGGAAAADTLAWLAYIWGTASSFAVIVTALASLFSVVTVLLAWLFLRERLARSQWAGVGVILLGILLVSV
jgi:drug/metabolite transporter (DMT)-like permease